ncbi:hypothetical protein ACN4DY_07590 [Corynebacterium macclintockiae]|uniref:DNA polymerase III subunit beta family protein n=1 Tax=Corynebacterium macclintockiae TaxID=2913501 RepID=UPI003EBF5A05
MARKPRVPKAPRIGGGGGRKRGPLSAETKMKIARSLARVKGDTSDWDPYEKKGRAPGKGDNGSGGAGKKPARMTTTTAKGGAKVTSGIDKHTGNKVTVSKTSGTAGKNRKNAKATANPFGDFPDNTVKGGGHQASKEYLTPDNIREEPGFRSDLQAVADRLTTPAKAEKYLDRLDDRMVRAMEDTGSPAKNRHNQRAAIHNYTQARELGLIDAELNRTGKKPVMPSKDKLPEVKAGDPEGNAKRAKGINAPVAGDKGKQAPKMKATAGKRKPATVKGEKAAEKPAKAAKPAKPTAKGAKGTKSAKNANTKPAKHPKVHGTYTPEEQAAERANPGRKGGIIDREAENLTPRQLNRLARYYGLDNEQKINQLGVDKGNKKFRHTPEFEKSYDKWLAKTVAPALDKLDPNGTIDRNDPEAVLEALGVGRKDGVDTRRALTSPIYFQTLSGDVRAAIAEHVGFVPSPVNMQRTNRGEKRPAVFAEAFTIQHRRQKAGELPRFAEDRKPVKPVKRPKGKRKTTTPAKPGPKRAAKPTQQAQEPQAKPKPNKESVGNNKPTAPAPAKPAGGVTYRPADGDNMPAVGHHDGVTAKGTHITRPDGSSVRGDVKPVKVDTDPDRADRYDNNGRYAQITGDGKHLIVANNESELDNMLRDYNNGRGEVGKLVADNGEAPERDLGLSDWKNGNRDRTYVNKWHEPAGFEFETYKNSGRPSWATIDGKGISNTRADKLRGGKVWVDNKTGELHVEAGNDELPADKIAERLIPELERQLGHPVTYKPKNGGNKPDVKPDAKPNAEAEKVANAEADKAETIAALTPYLAAEPQRLPDTPETINDPVQKAVDKAKAPERVADSVTDNRDMADRLLDVASSRGRDETLHFLTGVNFNVHDGDATVAATDRFRLSTEHIKIDAPDGNHLVDGKDFGEAMRAMKGVEGDFKLTDNGDGTYTLTRGDVSRNLKGIPGEFPKVAPLMPNVTEETRRFTVNAPALRKVALEAKRNSTRYGGLHFKPVEGKDAYHVSWTDKYGDVRTVDVPAKFSNDDTVDRPAFAVNQTYLADILGGVKGDVTVGNDAGHRPLRIVTDGEEQPTRLLMPIRADVPDMVAKPDVNNEARKQLNYLYDALATPKENRVAFNAKELRSLIKTAHEQATKDVKEGTPEYFLHATPDGRVRIAAGNAKSGVKVYGEMGIEPGQREMIIPLPNRDNRGNAIKAATINSNFRGDNAVFRVDDDGTVWLTTVSNETADQRNKGTVFTQGAVPIAHTPDMVRKYKQLLKKNGYDPDQGDSNDGMAALPGLNDVSKFDGDAAVKRAEKMEADRTRRELDEVGMTDAEKQTATAKRDNMPRLDGQNGLQAKAPTKATSKPDAQSSYTTAELKERGWKPKDIKALKEHKTTEKHRSATGVVDSFENNSRGQFTGYNLNRYDGDAVRDYEKGKDLGPHRVPTPPQIDGLELTSNKTRNGKTFFNVDNLADFTQNPEWFNVRLTPEGDVNVYEGKRLPPFPDGDDETWKWDTEKEALEKRLADALNGNVRHVERKPVQKQTRPPLPEGETLDRRDNVVRFRKAGGEWAVEGEDLQVGDVVTVKRRGGKKSTVTITELVSDENGHQVARFKNGGGRSRRAKRNTTTGGAKLDGQNGLNATTPDKRAGAEITPGVVHGDNGAPRLAEGYNRFTGNPEKPHGRVPQTKEEIAAVQKWQDMPLKNWAERRKAERALNADGIDTRNDYQREVDAAVAAYNPTPAEKRPDSRGLYFNDLGAWQTRGYRVNQTQLARPGESSTEDRLITIGDREIFAPAGGIYGQKNGRTVLEGVDTRTGEKVKLKSDQFGQWSEPVTIRQRAGRTFGRYSAAATPQNMHAIQEAEERYPLSDRWNPKTHDDADTINKIKRTMAEDMIKSDPYMDKAPDISDDAARAWALEKIKGNEFRSDFNRQNQGQRARAHESLMDGEHANTSIPWHTSPDSVHGPGGMYFTGETKTPTIYRGLNRDLDEGRDKLTAALVDDPDARLVTSVPGEGLKFVRPVKVDEFGYGYRVTATDDEGKKHYVKIATDNPGSGNAKIWRALRHADGTPYTRDEAAEYSSLKDELNRLPDVERVNWPEGRIWAQKRRPEIEARLEALRGKTNPTGGNTTPAKPETTAKAGAGKRHKKGTPFTSDNLKDGETLTENGAIRRGEYVITQAKTRDGKNGYAIVEQFGSHRMTRPTASKTLDKVRAEVDRMQAQRDKEQTAKALEFPELQLMSSAQLETIAAGTGAKAAAAQQLLNDRR